MATERLLHRTRRASPLVVAHRGLSARYPENTLVAFHAAMDAGADVIELDYYAAADGTLVCVHDRTLNRYLAPDAPARVKDRPVSTFTRAELEALDFGTWKHPQFAGTRVATLEDVVRLFTQDAMTRAGPVLLLERKEGSAQATFELLQACDAMERVIVQSFDWQFLQDFHALSPSTPTAVLGSGANLSAERLGDLAATGARIVHWNHEAFTAANVAWLHEQGLMAIAYTVNGEVGLRGARAIGLDGVTTDDCAVARAVYGDAGAA